MKPIRYKKSFAGAFIALTIILVFYAQANGANPAKPNNSSKSAAQNPQIKKTPTRQINWNAVSPSNFTPDMTVNDAINILRNTTIPPLNIVVLWKNLEAVDIYRETPIGIDGIKGASLRTHLKILLMSLSAGSTEKLGYVVNDGVIIISTESSLPHKLIARIYDITDLVGAPAGGGFMPGAGMPFGFGGMPFGGMMSFGLGGMLGGMTTLGAGYAGQGQQSYGNVGYR